MKANESTEELSKEAIAKRVITPTKKYFIVAGYGHVEADDISEVESKLKKLKKLEVNDVNN